MKLSLSWILSHISSDATTIDPSSIYTALSEKTTEIESFDQYTLDCTEYELVQIISIDQKTARCLSDEKIEYLLPLRTDCLIGQWYLAKKKPANAWVTVVDLGAQKDGLLPSIAPGTFAKKIYHDFVITIDNKAITHRPDLWGHRGFAREVAALFKIPLIPIETLTVQTTITESKTNSAKTVDGFVLEKQTDLCSKIAFCSLECKPVACDFNQARLLSSVDIRPINAIVDATNYVMADIGHPMHAFDQATFSDQKMIVRMAQPNETITLLDGSTVDLSDQDIVIANHQRPLSLAGVLGGKESGIQSTTERIVIEAAHFDGSTIRKTSQRHKKRTDASTRFEKELNPENTIIALRRFLSLVQPYYPNLPKTFEINVIGKKKPLPIIAIDHTTIETMIGIAIDQKEIVAILSRLEYRAEVKQGLYTVTVPSFRLTSEQITSADIVEEIARSYGYNAIIPQSISIPSRAHGNKRHMIINEIKNFSAFGMSLHELNSYAFFDETFIEKISYKPGKTLTIENPVSQNWTTLNDSLIPHLLKAVHDNYFDHAHINFFEIAPIWIFKNGTWTEQLTYAALWYDQTGNHTFYDGKAYVINLLNLYGITVEWKQVTDDTFWFEPYCSTTLVHQGETVGRAGIINAQIHPHITKHPQSSLFCVEFSLDWYIQSTKKIKYSPVSCYQTVHRDLSIFINNAITFDTLKNEIISLSTLIEKIEVIEFLEKEEWKDQRAITSRITFVDHTKTLTKEIIDQTMNTIKAKVKAYGATIR